MASYGSELRPHIDKAPIPAQVAIVDERGGEHGRHRLSNGADHEQGVGRDRLGAAESLDAEAAEI